MEFVPVEISGDSAVRARRNYSSDTGVWLVALSPTVTTERDANQRKRDSTSVDSLNTLNV